MLCPLTSGQSCGSMLSLNNWKSGFFALSFEAVSFLDTSGICGEVDLRISGIADLYTELVHLFPLHRQIRLVSRFAI